MVDKLDWTVLLKERDQLVDSEETEVDSVVETEVDSVEIITETQETPLSSSVKMIKTPKKEPSELLPVKRSFFDDSFK